MMPVIVAVARFPLAYLPRSAAHVVLIKWWTLPKTKPKKNIVHVNAPRPMLSWWNAMVKERQLAAKMASMQMGALRE